MMNDSLNAWLMFDAAVTHAPDSEIVTRYPDGGIVRATYRQVTQRSQQFMHALDELGLERGERVATLAWNTQRHLEAYFAVPCTARVLHTLNLRLSAEELSFIINDADDRLLLVDPDLVPLFEQIRPQVPGVRHVVVLGEVPPGAAPDLLAYEDLIADEPPRYEALPIEENSPLGLCYTSGTTGRPKGVLYTHRSTFLHALAITSAAAMAIGPGDCVLPQVPMFHATAWGMPYASALVGAKQVFFAGPLEPAGFAELLVGERVTVTAGVPTVWVSVAEELLRRQDELGALRHVVVGGAQPPPALIARYRDELGLQIVQAWGMTETSPLASMAWPQERMRDWPEDRVMEAARCQAGLPLPGVRISLRDEHGREVPADGTTMGDLWVRGPWVTDSYLHGRGADCFSEDGWFRTGDVAIASEDGYFVIADRTKDLIKSGGEWISSVDMEAAVVELPGVAEAAVIAVADPKWQERPLACVVLHDGHSLARDDVRASLEKRGFAHWQLPDRVEFLDELPKTGTGKVDKKLLRSRFAT